MAYRLLNNWHHVWDVRFPPPDYNGPLGNSAAAAEDPFDEDILRHDELALKPTASNVKNTTVVEADRPKGEVIVVAVEVLAIAGEIAINIFAFTHHAWRHHGRIAEIAGISFWAYVMALAIIRLVLSHSKVDSLGSLWYHTACLYGFKWMPTVLLFRSYITHPPSNLSRALMIGDFALNTLLTVIALGSRKGNKAVELEYEKDIPPAREVLASVFSLATFSWVDSIVWTGYKKTFEMADVWNLPREEKSATVMATYRQVKKTSSLAFHLLRYFRGSLMVQALWAAASGVLMFVPTLLLKAILQYVENPDDTPRSSAWFFVVLLFVSGCAAALADGQALWIGRKVCIQLRSIVIGEIYVKALKRKTGTTNDKILGAKADADEKAKPSLWKKIKSVGQKKRKVETKEVDKSEGSGEQVTSGTIINLMAVDSFKVAEISAYLHFLWAATPVQLVIAVTLLYQVLGASSIAGMIMMVVLFPVNFAISKRFATLQKKILAATDARIHSTNEVLTNIRIIKYFAWEQRFMAVVDEKRAAELKSLRSRYLTWAFAATVWGGAPVLITFLSFAVYTLVEKKPLIPSVAFTALSLFQLLRIPLDYLADMVAHVQEAKVSVDRVEEFLNEEETQKYKQLKIRHSDDGQSVIGFDNATFSWGSKTPLSTERTTSFKMMDLDIKFEIGQLNVVAGPTGSGKTSLLMALLGEMTLVDGKVHLPGARSREDLDHDRDTGLTESVAYCAQQAWLVNDTVKQNIVFASPWDSKRYKQVVDACSLAKDIEILDAGDETLVGEKGVTLSGGQKQRISLARALYCSARHVLLDDILSAVDSHTAKHIFEEALKGPLMNNRTCILVTHNISLCLPHAEFVVVLDNGRVASQGTANQVIHSGKLGEDLTKSTQASRAPSRVPSKAQLTELVDQEPAENGIDMDGHVLPGHDADKQGTPVAAPVDIGATPSKTVLEESKAVGGVKLSIIIMYLKSMGGLMYWILAALSFVALQASNVSTNVWIRQWANAYTQKQYGFMHSHGHMPASYVRSSSNSIPCMGTGSCGWNFPFVGNTTGGYSITDEYVEVNSSYYLGVYALLGVAFLIITFFRDAILFYGSLTASKAIHIKLIDSVSHAKFRFFDSTPLGQIMNRFSKDIESIDQEVAPVAIGVVHCLFSIVTIVVLISVITPGFLIAGIFISVLYYLIGMFYINSSRDLKRLESVQKSPLYQQFGESLTGMTTIRAYGDERRFIRENLDRVNTHNRPFIYLWAANRWLAFRVDVAGALVSFFAGIFVVLSVGRIDAGAAGLAMTYAVTFTENVLWFVRLYAANEQNMNSVERIKEYLDVEQEASSIIHDNRPPANWPSQGSVEFINYTTRYRKDLDPVLRKLTFKIGSCEKVGVVGRTGAGKSSLALALFRALEAEEGKILVDGVDIGLIGLQDLRENIVMVPQDPTLFTGTIRSNLDPFSLFTDEEIFTALRRVQLIGATAVPGGSASRPATPLPSTLPANDASIPKVNVPDELPSSSEAASNSSDTVNENASPAEGRENKNIFLDLTSSIADSGSNLSQGQRQLLCLARALLKDPKVLLMDEATASIDYATDAKIQETIRELTGNTIITIAHRLKTIVDYDKVVVMERGRIVEFGAPWELLRPNGKGEVDGDKGKASSDGGSDADVDGDGESQKGKRWFREMCEMSGELELLEQEAKKSWDAKKLIDDDEV